MIWSLTAVVGVTKKRKFTLHAGIGFPFQTLCNRYTDLKPMMINGREQSDETNCDHWSCSNPYTRDDGIWNCPNGQDESAFRPSFRVYFTGTILCQPQHLQYILFAHSQSEWWTRGIVLEGQMSGISANVPYSTSLSDSRFFCSGNAIPNAFTPDMDVW